MDAGVRLRWRKVLPDALPAMLGLERAANEGVGDRRLLDLIKIRASQLNGCAYCVRLHCMRRESDDRLDMMAVWRQVDCFGPAERAALAWCEALTMLPDSGAPEELFEELRRHLSDERIVALTLAIVAINGWNRMNVAFRTPVADAAAAARSAAEADPVSRRSGPGQPPKRTRSAAEADPV